MTMMALRSFPVAVATLLLLPKTICQTNDVALVGSGENSTYSSRNDILLVDSQNSTAGRTSASDQCGVWVGMSSLPGTGLGMFAGKNFKHGELLLPVGDLIIPIVDLGSRQTNSFLWRDYTWVDHSGYYGSTKMGAEDVSIASPGFGSTANSYMDFVNVNEDSGSEYNAFEEIHRLRDPEAGAFTKHHSRMSYARGDIRQGEELFNNYGDKW